MARTFTKVDLLAFLTDLLPEDALFTSLEVGYYTPTNAEEQLRHAASGVRQAIANDTFGPAEVSFSPDPVEKHIKIEVRA